MSTANAMADVQTGHEVVHPERTPSELTVPVGYLAVVG